MRLLIILTVVLAFFAADARADVDVLRLGDENPMMAIAKATFWGGVTGLLIGGALALIADDNQGEYIKWGLVGGVFVGFGFGVYHVLSRPSGESSLIETDGESLALSFPTVNIGLDRIEENRYITARATVFSYSF